MLCRNCLDQTAQGGPLGAPAYHPGPEHWEAVLCERCGSVIAPETHAQTLLADTVSQLSRFGLSEGGRPLLATPGSEDL